MALATKTQPGEIQLSGDLGGSSDATAPELSDTDVVAGSYIFPTLTLDGKGRVTNAVENADLTSYVDLATTTSHGIVQINDTGLDITTGSPGGGILSINFTEVANNLRDADVGVKGLVSIGSNIDVSSGSISVADAHSTTTKGVVKSADASNILITNGDIDIGPAVVRTDDEQTWTAAQTVQLVTLTYAATVSVNAALSNVFELTLTGNAMLGNPSNLSAGGHYVFIIKQDGTGGRTLGFNSAYLFKKGFSNAIASGSNEISVITCISNGTQLYCSVAKDFE